MGAEANTPGNHSLQEIEQVVDERNRHEPPSATEGDLKAESYEEGHHRDLPILLAVGRFMALYLLGKRGFTVSLRVNRAQHHCRRISREKQHLCQTAVVENLSHRYAIF